MLNKTRARNVRPYGYAVAFCSAVGARIARPLSEFVQNFEFAYLPFYA